MSYDDDEKPPTFCKVVLSIVSVIGGIIAFMTLNSQGKELYLTGVYNSDGSYDIEGTMWYWLFLDLL